MIFRMRGEDECMMILVFTASAWGSPQRSFKPVDFLKLSVLREILMLVEFTLFEFLLSCYFSKIRKILEWKDC